MQYLIMFLLGCFTAVFISPILEQLLNIITSWGQLVITKIAVEISDYEKMLNTESEMKMPQIGFSIDTTEESQEVENDTE